MKKLNLKIDSSTRETIQSSFDRIANEIISDWQLKIDNDLFSFTEIEFYFFCEAVHEDNSTHEHKYDEGLWRFHSQGIDITFQSTDISDGGILIRGLKSEKGYINGPRRILETIFKTFNSVTTVEHQFGLVSESSTSPSSVFKTTRHGLSKTEQNVFNDYQYRYYTDLANWDTKHVAQSEKAKIELNSKMLEI
jgi:hypothetical protein